MIVVTVPHTCGSDDPGCDKNADRLGQRLAKLIGAVFIKGKTPRKHCDLNRIACRNDAMRKRLTRMIDTGKATVVLDVHTFPHNEFPGIKDEWFVVMAAKDRSGPRRLYHAMQSAGFHTAFAQSTVNDIIHEASSGGVLAALLEIRDDFPLRLLPGVARVVEGWIRDTAG